MAKYDIVKGLFTCHTCKQEVPSLRMYASEKRLSWMCKDGHVSEVNLDTRRKKDIDEREVGE
jgi:hypothetical protein